jgi:hypothetical protein
VRRDGCDGWRKCKLAAPSRWTVAHPRPTTISANSDGCGVDSEQGILGRVLPVLADTFSSTIIVLAPWRTSDRPSTVTEPSVPLPRADHRRLGDAPASPPAAAATTTLSLRHG